MPGGAGRDGDQVTADGRGPGFRERQGRQAPAARSRLCAMEAQVSQAALAGKTPDIWEVRERPVGPVGEDLLHDRVVAVLAFGLGQLCLKP